MSTTEKKLSREEFARKMYQMDMAINFQHGLMNRRQFQKAMREPTPTEHLEEADLYLQGVLDAPLFMTNPEQCDEHEQSALNIIATWRSL